ncbi:regulatory protein, gntR family [Seinonella peptonophila]|uniref:Regulatory protein, gntR family n=1 Tax=Seinonella peptonophila TaxID=112248 RepID=A0A1M4T711_9BACL|nr:GntR family transcriptional regulator [Seinonella peptonophila]SHE40313.1 regulatory protein, gntR family [Seinonella peptonophila]
MAFKQTKWRTVYETLKKRIIDGTYPSKSEFPTNKEIGEEFNLHTVSVQTAVTELIREGLVTPAQNRATRRRVRSIPTRSKRSIFFSEVHDQKASKNALALNIVDAATIPDTIRNSVHHKQCFITTKNSF